MRERNMLLVMLAGQSNMAGRGKVEPEDLEVIPGLMMMNKRFEWVPAVEPMTEDRPTHGVGPGRTFGRLLLERNPGRVVGLLPCAVGGSPVSAWKPGACDPRYHLGEKPYDDAVARAEKAAENGVFAAILWHQGEDDAAIRNPRYEEDLFEVLSNFRRDLNAPDAPVVCGELGRYFDPARFDTPMIDRAMKRAAAKLGNAAWASSEGLSDLGDGLHFNSACARELGRRYFAKYLELTDGKQ